MTDNANVHILIVDDLKENLMSLEGLLRQEGLVILKARTGREALELLLKHEVALAILDVQMPEMDGFELAELMRGMELTKAVPLIFLTAGSFDQQRRFRGYEMGAVDFLHKPIEPDILRAKTEVFLELYRQKQQLRVQRDELKVLAEANARLLGESRRYSQALEDDDRRKDEFLATLAHELRNPLAPIGNGLQILQMSRDEKTIENIRALMERQFNHLVRLIDDLMDVSRIRQGKIDLRLENICLQNVLQVALETSAPLIKTSGHNLHLDIAQEEILFEGDLTRLAQIVSNLLNNAAKYTPRGGHITLALRQQEGQAVIEVSDNGMGIPETMLPKVFQLFTQVDRHMERAQGGLGIGLALVKQLVEMHGGKVSAVSKGQDKGSTFRVALPLAQSAEHNSAQKPSPAKKLEKQALRRILVVDDNVPSAQTIGWTLEFMGHEYRLVHDGMKVLEAAREYKPDVILLDIGLPDINGYEICRSLRQNKEFEHIIVIAQTGWGQEKARSAAKEAGFNYHLTKPINFDELSDILAKETA